MNDQLIPQSDQYIEKSIKKLNRWLIGLIVFIIVYSLLVLYIITPTIVPDNHSNISMGIDSISYSNINNPVILQTNLISLVITNITPVFSTMFTQKDSYEIGDFVIVNFFYIEGIIIEKISTNRYKVLYRNNFRALTTVVLRKELLLVPVSFSDKKP